MLSKLCSKNVRHQDKQNDASQAQISIEQQTADAIAAQVKHPPINNKQHKDFSRARCRMFFPTSGRMGFDTIKTSTEFPPIEIVREMITYETSIRLSEPIQELMDFYHNDETSLSRVLDLIQQHVVEHFGYHDVNALGTALHRFPDDPVVKSAYYVKHNKITQGLISQGQCARDVDLYTTEGQSRNLFSQITAGQPLVILAGSTS
ncbi:unnamed protein product [Rotaria magnacalcarata]|uniref:Uncharacterized protein n=3 Tax=Rotaria magnacalcarata TaxID=392030 RepID=A0A816BEQ4_9BILA|nr:unnamed protein product [Rotaria magnacalcarata]